jgi:hypothetical protein
MFMSVASGLLILTGLEIMAFGLFMLYAWLALLYAPIGFDAGILLGRHSPGMLVQQRLLSALLARLFLAPGHMHSSPAGACCLVFPAVSCLAFPWPPLSDSMAGLMASLAECSHWSAARLEACSRRGSSICLSSVHLPLIGAALVMTGANHILPGGGEFNPAAGGILPSLVTIILVVAGPSWQRSNITRWAQAEPADRDV